MLILVSVVVPLAINNAQAEMSRDKSRDIPKISRYIWTTKKSRDVRKFFKYIRKVFANF